jgi:Mn2+/Fe2+ NRAMP family transporter
MFDQLSRRLRAFGPGLVLAAAGIGAGDVVTAAVSGIRFGTALIWAVVFTVILKFVLTEAVARWQVATGETLVYAWASRLPKWVTIYFGGYLVLWTFLVGASLSSACGLAGTSLFNTLSVPAWGAIHSVLAAVLVAFNRYEQFLKVTKILVAVMAISVLVCAALTLPPILTILRGLFIPSVPQPGGGAAVLSLLGGLGGSVTMACYGMWMRDAGWTGGDRLPTVRNDLGLAYAFTGIFGIAIMLIATGAQAQGAGGTQIALELANRLGTVGGPAFRWIFLIGFWATVFTAMMSVWQGVPQIYVELARAWRRQPPGRPAIEDRRTYYGSLFLVAIPPLIMLWFRQPVALVVTFAVAGAFFVPFLASTLLYLCNRRDLMGPLKTGRWGNLWLIVCLVVFGAVCIREVATILTR